MSALRAPGTGCGLLGQAWGLRARPPVQQCASIARHGLVGREAWQSHALLFAIAELLLPDMACVI